MAVDEEADGEMTQRGPEEPEDGPDDESTDEELTGELDLSGEAPSVRADAHLLRVDVRREWFRVLVRVLGAEFRTGFGREWRGRPGGWSDRAFPMFAAGAFVLFAVAAALFTAIVMTQFVLGSDVAGWRRLAVGAVSFLLVFGVALLAPRIVAKDNNER